MTLSVGTALTAVTAGDQAVAFDAVVAAAVPSGAAVAANIQ